ncbi:DUF3316 domain-containing protein [Leucothrix sargassi]|nr:DUF3316 domain-containing protein [Leucothrix sargassi]
MMTLPDLMATSSLLIGPTAANAAYFGDGTNSTKTFMTEAKHSREEAMQAGADKLHMLKSLPPMDLASELALYDASIDQSTVQVNEGAYVTIEERITVNDESRFIGIVHLHYSYAMLDIAV